MRGRNSGRPEEVIERLQTTEPYESAVNGLNFTNFYSGGLHSAYLRGAALLQLGRHKEAAEEFQKIVDQRGLVTLDVIGVLAHLQLGRVHVAAGDRVKAKAEYESFLKMWKDADADVPVLKQAKTEYARLP